jgi:hypothetical protein
MKIPDIKKISKKAEVWKVGYEKIKGKWVIEYTRQNTTIPIDKKLLRKLGIKKGEEVLSIATYYGSWASAIADAGAIVDYSDASKSITAWAEKNLKGFRKFICSDYIYLPKKKLEYDWTFTFEALGGKQGLPIAYLRSLLNKKGGILVNFPRLDKQGNPVGSKDKRYPFIVKTLAKLYGAKAKVKNIFISVTRNRKPVKTNHKVYTIITNLKARKLAEKDIEALFSGKIRAGSRKRLNKIATLLIRPEFVKEI